MSLKELSLKSFIKQKDLKDINCSLLNSLLIEINENKINLEEYEIALFLNKLIEQMICEDFRNVKSLITNIYSTLPIEMLYIPHDYELLKDRLKSINLETIYTKSDVIYILKYFIEVFPELVNYSGLDSIENTPSDEYRLRDLYIDDILNANRPAFTPLFANPTKPLRQETQIKYDYYIGFEAFNNSGGQPVLEQIALENLLKNVSKEKQDKNNKLNHDTIILK